MQTPTTPCPADQAAPIRRPVALNELALDAGITPEHVGAYVRGQAAFLTAPYRFVRSDCGLQAVSQ